MAPALALQPVRVQPVQVQPAKLNPPAGLHNDPDHDQPALSGPPTNRWRGQLTRVSASVRLVAPLVGPISAEIPGCPLRHESDLPEVLLSTPYQSRRCSRHSRNKLPPYPSVAHEDEVFFSQKIESGDGSEALWPQ